MYWQVETTLQNQLSPTLQPIVACELPRHHINGERELLKMQASNGKEPCGTSRLIEAGMEKV